MQEPKNLSVVLLAAVLGAASTCGYAKNFDCRSCHASGVAPGARNFDRIYANPSAHHPVGIEYPIGLNANPALHPPNGHDGGILFFDTNGNGHADDDEIQLFDESGFVTVECASCHKEHGNMPAPANAKRTYLRVDNTDSALCMICHKF